MTDNVKNKIAGTGGQSHRRLWEFIFVAVLVLYPLRHIVAAMNYRFCLFVALFPIKTYKPIA